MKFSYSLFFVVVSTVLLSAQSWDRLSSGRLISVKEGDNITKAYFNPIKVTDKRSDQELMYAYYDQEKIHSTQGSFTGYLLHGPIESFNAEKQLITQGEYINGLKNGKWLYWHPNGKLLKVEHWQKGQQYGREEHFDLTGQLCLRQHYKKGKLHGKVEVYSNGEKLSEVKYVKGKVKVKRVKKEGNANRSG